MLYDLQSGQWTEVGRSYIAKLENLTGVRRLRLLKGLWAMAEGMVYADVWNPAVHLIDRFEIPADWPRILSVDFGYTNPFACQWWALDHDGRMFRYREIYQTRCLVEDHARGILDAMAGEPRPVAVVCDHDAEDRATLERHLGLGTIPAVKTISDGIQATAGRMKVAGDGRARIFLMRDSLVERDLDLVDRKLPTCTEEEIEGYCFIAGTQVMTRSGTKPIEEIRPGDLVWTREGLKRVLAAGVTRDLAPVWTVTFSDGRSLTGTGGHPVFVSNKGWVSLRSLSSSDTIEQWVKALPLPSMVLPTDVIPTQKAGLIGTTSALLRLIVRRGRAACTLISGNRFTAMFRKAAISITKIITHSTIPSTILSAWRRKTTLTRIEAIPSAGHLNGSKNWIRLENFPYSGREARKEGGWPVTANGALWRNWLPLSINASNAENFSSVAIAANSASALPPATPHGAWLNVPIMRRGFALFAGRLFPWISGRSNPAVPAHAVKVIKEPARMRVYNLVVDECPEYYANGFLVHNCWDERKDLPIAKDNHSMDAMRYACMFAESSSKGVYV